MALNMVQNNEMEESCNFPPFLITTPYLEDMSAMTGNTLPLLALGDQHTKLCSGCNVEKDVSEFYRVEHCKNGLNSKCKECVKKRVKAYRDANKTKTANLAKEYRKNNKDKIRAYQREYREKNEEKIKLQKKVYERDNKLRLAEHRREYYKKNKSKLAAQNKKRYAANIEKVKEYRRKNKERIAKKSKEYNSRPEVKEARNKKLRRKRKSDPMFRLNSNMGKYVSTVLRSEKRYRHWESLVGYTLKDLKKHLEKKFVDGMTWDNYGEWHVDHKIPLAVHNFVTPNDMDFQKAWALDNLQPLWANENISKKDKLDKPFQPSLAFGGAR